jgi:hypothetical protein
MHITCADNRRESPAAASSDLTAAVLPLPLESILNLAVEQWRQQNEGVQVAFREAHKGICSRIRLTWTLTPRPGLRQALFGCQLLIE